MSFYCPRGPGPGSPFKPPFDGSAEWREDRTCSYCGGLDPEYLIQRLAAGDVRLIGTDKPYKLYVVNAGGPPLMSTHRACPDVRACKGPEACEHWVTKETTQAKFYVGHLSDEQRSRIRKMGLS